MNFVINFVIFFKRQYQNFKGFFLDKFAVFDFSMRRVISTSTNINCSVLTF